jgi:predicted nucleic acid-binding protein
MIGAGRNKSDAEPGHLCRWWATVRVACRRLGRSIDVADAWIAATALLYGVPLVTHNAGHFESVPGLVIYSGA